MASKTKQTAARPAPTEDHHGVGFREFIRRPLDILRAYNKKEWSDDLVAGLTVASVAIPQGIAYASIAELPPHYGLYTAAVAAVVGSMWGSSRHLATGPVNAISLLTLPILLAVGTPGSPRYLLAASLLAVMVGLLNIGLARLHFGALVTLASRSVLHGFAAGAGVHIVVGQMRHLLGVDVPAAPQLFRSAAAIFAAAGSTHRVSLMVGVAALVGLALFRRLGRRVPGALICITGAACAVYFLGLEALGVKVVGEIPRSLPPLTLLATGILPDMEMVRSLIVGAMAVAALGLVEAVASAQTLARLSGHRLDSNQEFFGQGLANIAAGMFSGYPCSGSFTRSALAHQSGGKTQLAGAITGVTILAGMLVLAPYARLIPRPAIAGVLLLVAWEMVDREGIKRAFRTSRSESFILVSTFVATLLLPLEFAVLSGIVFSLAFFVIRSSLPKVYQVVPDKNFHHVVHRPEAPVCPQMAVMNIRGPLFFGAVYHIEEELRHNHEHYPGQSFLVLRMHSVDICDLSGVEMLEATVKTYRQRGGDVFLIRPHGSVMDILLKSDFIDDNLGPDNILEQEDPIDHLINTVLDPSVCVYECEHRVFAECQGLDKHCYGDNMPTAEHHLLGHHLHITSETFMHLAHDPAALVIDVREPEEFRRGHVDGANLLPLRLLPELGPDLPRDRILLLCCRSGRRTARAMSMLENLGFTRLYGLKGGFFAWRAEGLPVTPVPEDQEAEIMKVKPPTTP